jgi:hypothetical protein
MLEMQTIRVCDGADAVAQLARLGGTSAKSRPRDAGGTQERGGPVASLSLVIGSLFLGGVWGCLLPRPLAWRCAANMLPPSPQVQLIYNSNHAPSPERKGTLIEARFELHTAYAICRESGSPRPASGQLRPRRTSRSPKTAFGSMAASILATTVKALVFGYQLSNLVADLYSLKIRPCRRHAAGPPTRH